MIRILAFFVLLVLAAPVYAAGEAKTPPNIDWSFEGPFGTFDRGALQRGYKVYKQVCASCHGMDQLAYRHLTDIGFSEAQVKAIASQDFVVDGPNDEGEMFERPARPSDYFPDPYKNEEEARYVNNGAYPPDMSLIVKARPHGADYIKALLLGYEDPPEGVKLRTGQYWNKYMPGHKIAMPPPLTTDGLVEYDDGTVATREQMARDVAHFLAWASNPEMEERKQMGWKFLLYMLVFAGVLYGAKKQIWKRLKA